MALTEYFKVLYEKIFPVPEAELQYRNDLLLIDAANKRPLVHFEADDIDCSRDLRVYSVEEFDALDRLTDKFFYDILGR